MSDQVTVADVSDEQGGAPSDAPPPGRPRRFVGRLRELIGRGFSPLSRFYAPIGRFVEHVRSHPHTQHPRTRRALVVLGRGAVLVLIAAIGGWIGAALAPSTTAYVGPLTAEIKVVPSFDPGVTVLLPPAGRVEFDTHVGPLAVQARVSEVDLEGAKELISSPGGLLALERSGPEALRSAVIHAAVMTSVFALAGAALLSLLWYRRRWLRTIEVAAAMAALLVAAGGVTAASFDPDKFASPKFSGLLSQAPYIAGSASSLLDRLEGYRSGMADIVQGVTSLYATAGALADSPATGSDDVTTVLHVSDIHLNPLAFDVIDRLVKQFKVDLVVDTGDIVTWGTSVESPTLRRISDVPVPYVYVRGNHDSMATQAAVGANPNAVVLDGEVLDGAVREVEGLTIGGIGDPKFTPDKTENLDPSEAAVVESQGVTPGEPVQTTGTGSPVPTAQKSAAASDAVGNGEQAGSDQGLEPDQAVDVDEAAAGAVLAAHIGSWNAKHAGNPVEIGAVHEPGAIGPLLGRVPLVLAGHTHKREVRQDPSGTLIMIEGSTGGAGITSGGLRRLTDGSPLPISATLIYLAKTGPRAGRVVAYDEVTMGGFGLTSVTLQRHVVRADDELPLTPPTPATTSSTPPSTSRPTQTETKAP